MKQNDRCDWCCQRAETDQAREIDKLYLHTIRMNGAARTCEELYRNYCRFIKDKGHEEATESPSPRPA